MPQLPDRFPLPDHMKDMACHAFHAATETTKNITRRSVLAFGALLLAQAVEQPLMDAHYGTNGTDIVVPGPADRAAGPP